MGRRAAPRGAALALALLGAVALAVHADTRVDLSSKQWSLQNTNGSVSVTTELPAYPLEVLRAEGLIPNPLWRYGELETRWLAEETWTFSLSWDSDASDMEELLDSREVLLRLDGVDTFATIELNGETVLEANNFHRRWAVPVKQLLRRGSGKSNTLTITLRPAATETVALKAAHPYSMPGLKQMGSIGAYTFARKPASDFGWDWGPAYAASGIHADVWLQGLDGATLDDAYVAQHHEGDAFVLDVTGQLLLPPGADEDGEFSVELPQLELEKRVALSSSGDAHRAAVTTSEHGVRIAEVTARLTVPASDVNLWWPVGYGKPTRYRVKLSFEPEKGEASSLKRKVGFRTVQLVRLPLAQAIKDLFPPGYPGWDAHGSLAVANKDYGDGQWAMTANGERWQHYAKGANLSDTSGESFYFKVNGIPIYAKGANMIPSHIVHTSATSQMLRDTLDYALQSNMNMVRVWGGGRYPVRALVEHADRTGLIIWMEAMFACSPYPRDPDFLDNVAAEVTQQARRLSWHPSVAIWSGNNEIEGSLNWYAESRSNKQLFSNDYQALFIDTIRKSLRAVNKHVPFVDSSPSNGAIVDNDREYIKRWGDDWDSNYGDVHWYAYDSDCEDYTTYPQSKFISEFGWQSYPTFATYAQATAPADWAVDDPMTGFRNRRFPQQEALEKFEAQFKRHFRLPSSWSAPGNPVKAAQLFKSFLYITHMQQARCYEAAINYWRRLRSHPVGLTMGVLYWQLNDIAEFASWSSYDYGGRWKPLAYSIKRMYAPLQAQAVYDPADAAVKVFLVNDHTAPVAATVSLRLLAFNHTTDACGASAASATAPTRDYERRPGGVAPVATFDFVVPPGFASQAWAMPLAELLATRPGCSETSCYVSVTAVPKPAQRGAPSHIEASEAQLLLAPLRAIALADPQLSLSHFEEDRAAAAVAAASEPAPADADDADEPALPPGADGASSAPAHGDAPLPITFTLAASHPAALTHLRTSIRGRFSDDALTVLHPCEPKRVTFFPHASAGRVSAAQLRADLTAESLFDHQFDGDTPVAPPSAAAAAKHATVAVTGMRGAAKRPAAPAAAAAAKAQAVIKVAT